MSSDMWLCLSVCSPGGGTCPLMCLYLSVCSPGGGTCPLTCLCLSSQYLKKGNLQEPAESSGNPWVSFLSANPEVAGETRPEYAPNTPDRPLNTPQTISKHLTFQYHSLKPVRNNILCAYELFTVHIAHTTQIIHTTETDYSLDYFYLKRSIGHRMYMILFTLLLLHIRS